MTARYMELNGGFLTLPKQGKNMQDAFGLILLQHSIWNGSGRSSHSIHFASQETALLSQVPLPRLIDAD